MNDLLTYTTFYTVEDAKPLIEMLEKEGIPYEIDHETNQLEPVYIGETLDPMVVLRIPQDQFSKLNALIEERAEETIGADSDYYLYSFTDDELIAVVRQPEEWNAFDRTLAEKILTERKVVIPPMNPVEKIPYQPERLKKEWIIIGYLLSALTLPGIFIGIAITQGRKTLSNGHRVPLYDQYSIRHGKNMTVVGIITTIYFVIRLFLLT